MLTSVFMVGLDASAIGAALPAIASSFQISGDRAVLIVNANQLAVTMLLLSAAALGEIIGHQRIYLSGLALIATGAVGASMANSFDLVVAMRFLQGVGFAGVMATYGAIVRSIFPERQLAHGIALVAFSMACMTALGPPIAAMVLTLGSYRWLFLFCVPLSLVAIVVGIRSLPETSRSGGRFDFGSALMSAAAIGMVFLCMIRLSGGKLTWLEPVQLTIGIGIGAVLWRRSSTSAAPFLPVDLFASALLRRSYLTSVLSFAAQLIILISMPFILHGKLGYNEANTALLMTPMAVALAISALLSARLYQRFGASTLGGVGLSLMAVGACLLALLRPGASALDILVRIALTGFGFGLFQTPNNRVLLGSMPRHRSGGAGSMQAMMRLLGQALGAVVTALIMRLMGPSSGATLWLAALLAGCGTVASFSRLKHDAR